MLKDILFFILKGIMFGIIGESGLGKIIFGKFIVGIESLMFGEIDYNG